MNIRILSAIALTAIMLSAPAARAEDSVGGFSIIQNDPQAGEQAATNDRLLIVNGSSGRVVYDDGQNDLFCVTRRVIIGYNSYGNPIRRRTMYCR